LNFEFSLPYEFIKRKRNKFVFLYPDDLQHVEHYQSVLGLCSGDCRCTVAWSCIIVTWWSGACGIEEALSERPTGFLHCFDTVSLVIWPVKIVPEMTYNVKPYTTTADAQSPVCMYQIYGTLLHCKESTI